MNRSILWCPWCILASAALSVVALQPAVAASWTNSASGLWRVGSNWDIGVAPGIFTGTTRITNPDTKTVLIDALTPASNLVISALNLGGPAGTTNTLALVDVGTNQPLVVSNQTLTLYGGSALAITNSSLVVTGRFISFNVYMGDIVLDSGSIVVREEPATTNVTVFSRLGRTNSATLTINSGMAHFSTLLIGESQGLMFPRSSGTVRVNGGLLSVAGELSIADAPGCTGTVAVTSGRLLVPNNLTNITRVGDFGRGTLFVSNGIAELGNVSVARHDGALGTLTVADGGLVTCGDDLSIGRFSGATGAVLVAGGELIVTNHSTWVGREGIGQLAVSAGYVEMDDLLVAAVPTNTAHGTFTLTGGTVLCSSNLVLGDGSLSTGRVDIAGGELVVTNRSKPALLIMKAGTLRVTGGRVTAENLVLTNAGARFDFSGGTLETRDTTVSNGVTFVVGDGIQAATLRLAGGVHTFADGLVISSNATLIACGAVIGPIVNHGTIITNCEPAGLAPSITQQPVGLAVTEGSPASLSLTATGTPPLSYQWRLEGTPLAGATTNEFTLANAQAGDAGAYDVVVTNNFGAVTSAVALVRVLVAPTLVQPQLIEGDSFGFSWQGVKYLNYRVEYKNALNDPDWLLLTNPIGDGNPIFIPDSPLTATNRFYRVLAE